jgi:ribosomal protein S18 acetylase RimI-like enzyme
MEAARYGSAVEIRPATEADLDAMVEVVFAEPGVEQLAFMPSIAGARRFSREAWRRAGIDEFVVAEDGDELVGFASCSEHGVSLGEGARAAVAGWGLVGPLRLLLRGWPRQLVELPLPAGPTLVELQKHPARRGTGVGTLLLEHVIEATDGRSLSLTTRSNNPARRLYERHGFTVQAEKSHRAFERRTGAQGRILTVRPAQQHN